LIAGITFVDGPIKDWVEELAPPAAGGIGDNVISAGIAGGLIAGFASTAFAVTRGST